MCAQKGDFNGVWRVAEPCVAREGRQVSGHLWLSVPYRLSAALHSPPQREIVHAWWELSCGWGPWLSIRIFALEWMHMCTWCDGHGHCFSSLGWTAFPWLHILCSGHLGAKNIPTLQCIGNGWRFFASLWFQYIGRMWAWMATNYLLKRIHVWQWTTRHITRVYAMRTLLYEVYIEMVLVSTAKCRQNATEWPKCNASFSFPSYIGCIGCRKALVPGCKIFIFSYLSKDF